MDLVAAEQLNGKLWRLAKQGAFLCFLVACALLGASLILQPGHIGNGQASMVSEVVPGR